MTDQTQISEAKWSIPLGTFTLVIVGVLIGAAGAEIIRNISGGEKLAFSTTELIGFVLSVVLSAASIVLAIAAIWMGKITEVSIIRRSDESIRLQNEVFVRTTEALQRIEASTGVTEKRIEDIIQGRVGDISHKIAELATQRSGVLRDPASLEDEIRSSILKGVRAEKSPDYAKELEERHKKAEERQQRYREFHQATLNTFANLPDAKTLKLGDGKFNGSGFDLYDVVIEKAGSKVAASSFTLATGLEEDFSTFLFAAARTLIEGTVDHVVLLFDGDRAEQEKLQKIVQDTLSPLKGDPQERIQILVAIAAEIESAVNALYSKA